MTRLVTGRLILRPWLETDRGSYVTMNADPRTTRFFPAAYSPDEASASFDRILRWQDQGELCFGLAERHDGHFVGMVGLSEMQDCGPGLDGETEIGWRLAPDCYGQGYATEAAREWLRHGFDTLRLPQIVAWTAAPNLPSQAVMQRLGMARAPDLDRDHPRVVAGSPLRPHLVWRIAAR
jgi:RimJ/RimL family protein N-acetyltransferase